MENDHKTIFIVGGGPSLLNYDWELLRYRYVIAINRAFEVLPWAKIVYFQDFKFWNEYQFKGLLSHEGKLITMDDKVNHPRVYNYQNTGRTGLDLTPGCLRHGKNSGYAAINLAVHLGATRIVLLGYDMSTKMTDVSDIKSKNVVRVTGRSHWHSGYKTSPNLNTYPVMLPNFSTIVKPLEDLGIGVYNANPHSKLTVFPKIPLEVAHLIEDVDLQPA